MADRQILLRRELNAVEQGGLRLLDVLRWPGPFGSGLRIYIGRNSDVGKLHKDQPGGVRLSGAVPVAGNAIVTGNAPDGAGALSLDLGGMVTLQTSVPETDLFDDLNVFLAMRHRESPDQVADWMRYHVDHHGLNGLVIFDRSEGGPARDAFAEGLQNAAAKIDGLQRVMLVTAPIPLGRPDQAASGDAGTAPRSKDRHFTPDPWRSPLAEPVLYDILKWRFLARAGAVLALDPCDILRDPQDGITVFDSCRQSHTGMMPAQGEAVYPWRVRKGRAPALADHICRAAPAVPAPNRWAVAPRRGSPADIWLPGGIKGATGLVEEIVAYDRAVSVMFPDSEVAELINKDVLEQDEILLTRARDVLGNNPILPPRRERAPAKVVFEPPSGRTAIVTCMKNEGPFILEWIAYHRMIGVDDFLVYTNDCDDGTDQLLDALQDRGLVQRRDNPFRGTGGKPQQSALAAALTEPLVTQAGWIISMDVDEFINVHVGANRLPDLYGAIGDANMISLTWRLFGNSDVETYDDRPVIEQFTRCAPHLIRRPHQAWGFKTLFRNQGLWESLGVHRPRGHLGGPVNWVNGSGAPMPERMLKTGWRSAMDSYGYDLATLNHYSVRNAESFLVKRDRGRVNHVARDQGVGYWFRMNNNDEQDLSIQRHVHGLKAEIDALKAEKEIAMLHDQAVAAHRAKIKMLMKDAEFSDLYAQLCSDRMRRLSRMHRHFGMNVFLRGPSVVPERVFEPDLPPDFFFNTAPPEGKPAS